MAVLDRGGAVSYERGTPVVIAPAPEGDPPSLAGGETVDIWAVRAPKWMYLRGLSEPTLLDAS